MSEGQRARLKNKRDWYAQNLASCERDRRRVPWLALLGLSVLPAGWYAGLLGVMLAILGTVGVVGFSIYLVNGHREDYRLRLAEVERKLARLDAASRR